MSPRIFVSQLYPAAKEVCYPRSVSPAGALIQCSWESNWGQTGDLGVWFGIKAWTSAHPSTSQPTWEVVNGQRIRVESGFEKAPDFKTACAWYCDFLLVGPRYAECLKYRDDWRGFVKAVGAAGYATDPQYVSHLLARGVVLEQWLYRLGLEH